MKNATQVSGIGRSNVWILSGWAAALLLAVSPAQAANEEASTQAVSNQKNCAGKSGDDKARCLKAIARKKTVKPCNTCTTPNRGDANPIPDSTKKENMKKSENTKKQVKKSNATPAEEQTPAKK
jgi:hypothetical protein